MARCPGTLTTGSKGAQRSDKIRDGAARAVTRGAPSSNQNGENTMPMEKVTVLLLTLIVSAILSACGSDPALQKPTSS